MTDRDPTTRITSPGRLALGLLHVFVMVGSAACTGEDSPTGPEPLFAEVACPDLSLASLSGVTLDEIAVGALPPSFGDPVAAALGAEDGEPDGIAFVRPDESEVLQLHVPLHPDTPLEGGAITLTFTDGVSACAPIDFAIQPLPEADGELSATVELLQELIAEQAAMLGATPDELRATAYDEMSADLWPIAMAQTLLDDPTNMESLRAVADGAAGAEVLDWVDRLLARTDVRSALEAASSPSIDVGVPAAPPSAAT